MSPQPGPIEGIVVDQRTAGPRAAALVTVESRTLEARSGSGGHFLLAPTEVVTRLEDLRRPWASAELGELATEVIAIETRGRPPRGVVANRWLAAPVAYSHRK